MSDKKQKKGLQALLNKQQKKKNAQNTTSSKKEDEEPTNATLGIKQDPSVDAESPELPKQKAPVAAKAANDGGDDSSDDELDFAVDVGNKIVEQQNDSSKEQDVVKADYMMKKDGADGAQAQKEKDKPKRNDASNIKFGGGRPMFKRGKNVAGIGGDDFVGLDELDDQGKKKESQRKTAANGGIEFKNLSSTAVSGKKHEEEKEKESKPAERPRFFGKAKIAGGNAEAKQMTGTNITYDFGVKFAGQNKDKPNDADGNKGKNERKEAIPDQVRKDTRKINQNQEKNRFGTRDGGLDENELEDGFEVVNDRNQKRRQQRVQARTEDKDGEQRDEAPKSWQRDEAPKSWQRDEAPKSSQIKRGGAFGNLGGNDDSD